MHVDKGGLIFDFVLVKGDFSNYKYYSVRDLECIKY